MYVGEIDNLVFPNKNLILFNKNLINWPVLIFRVNLFPKLY